MNLDDINRMGRELYRDPALAVPMRDALEDLGLTWNDWMERSGTLDRLAECMIVALGGQLPSSDTLQEYLTSCGFSELILDDIAYVTPAAFGLLAKVLQMPSVLVQVQFVVVDPNEAEDRYHWDPPSRELASEVLSRANQFSEARQGFDEAILSLEITQGKFLDELQETVRGHYPEARGYQLCFGNGPWNSRRPRLWNPRDWFNYVLLDVFDD